MLTVLAQCKQECLGHTRALPGHTSRNGRQLAPTARATTSIIQAQPPPSSRGGGGLTPSMWIIARTPPPVKLSATTGKCSALTSCEHGPCLSRESCFVQEVHSAGLHHTPVASASASSLVASSLEMSDADVYAPEDEPVRGGLRRETRHNADLALPE